MEPASPSGSHPSSPSLFQICYRYCYSPRQSDHDDSRHQEPSSSIGFPAVATGLRDWLWSRWQSLHDPHPVQCVRSMVISASGRLIAVLDQDIITILTEADGFKEPSGVYKGSSQTGSFMHGIWLDEICILTLATSRNIILFLDLKGKEVSSICTKQWKAKGNIIGMSPKSLPYASGLTRYGLIILTSDCTLHQLGVGENGLEELKQNDSSIHLQSFVRKHHPYGVLCQGLNPEKSVLVLVGPTSGARKNLDMAGKYCISIWRITDSSPYMEFIYATDLEDFCAQPGWQTVDFRSSHVPKVLISSSMKYLVILDCRGRLHIFNIKKIPELVLQRNEVVARRCNENVSDSIIKNHMLDSREKTDIKTNEGGVQSYQCNNFGYFPVVLPVEGSEETNETGQFETTDDIHDACWLSEETLVIAKRGGSFNIVTVSSLGILSEDAPSFPFARVHAIQDSKTSHIFVLEDLPKNAPVELKQVSQTDKKLTTVEKESSLLELTEKMRTGWRLVTLVEHSLPEMYRVLIEGGEYTSALILAAKYNLDTDLVYETRWLQSDHGQEALHQNLPKIQDKLWVLKQCMETICLNSESMNSLLQYGLFVTDCSMQGISGHNLIEAVQNIMERNFCFMRLRLLQYKDRLETFLGLSMGRFFPEEYAVFRSTTLQDIAIRFAEGAKIGSLNLLYKRHMYSLTPHILTILNAIPETVAPHTYSQLLPQLSATQPHFTWRDEDWVEKEEILEALIKHSRGLEGGNFNVNPQDCTEYTVKHCYGLAWLSRKEIVEWYHTRARAIDRVSGQLENSLSLLDLGHQKGIEELQFLLEDVSDLFGVIYMASDNDNMKPNMTLYDWEQLMDYDKFKMILQGVNESNVLNRLKERAVPFMNRKCERSSSYRKGTSVKIFDGDHANVELLKESFLVKWLRELSSANQLEICAAVLAEACENDNWLFKDDVEIAEVGLDCIYSCTSVDQWDLMASMLPKLLASGLGPEAVSTEEHCNWDKRSRRSFLSKSKGPVGGRSDVKLMMSPIFPTKEDKDGSLSGEAVYEALNGRVHRAEGHVEAGRLLLQYQVPKPIGFFLNASKDEKVVKQLLRLLLSKYGRRQPVKSDAEWTIMWKDLQALQIKAFSFLDKQYLFLEYCRGLLKAGKFSLAKIQLKNTGSISLTAEKAEKVVVQVAREYFYSASSLDDSEIGKARQCLSLLPGSKTVDAEINLIDAVTTKLPSLGVYLLPMQIRQIRDPLEIVKMALNSNAGAYLKVDELLEVAKLFGISASDDIAMIKALIAREAVASGDLELALGLCLFLVKEGYGAIWDLCAALARGPELKGMDLKSRKELLGFALSHCDDESVGELLYAWKETDLLNLCTDLRLAVERKGSYLSEMEAFLPPHLDGNISKQKWLAWNHCSDCRIFEMEHELGLLIKDEQSGDLIQMLRQVLLEAAEEFSIPENFDWESSAKESKKLLAFACFQLPWLLRLIKINSEGFLSRGEDTEGSNATHASCMKEAPHFAKEFITLSSQAVAVILSGLANHDIPPRDEIICAIAQAAMENPVKGENDMITCGYLLNASDSYQGVHIFEKKLQLGGDYEAGCNILKMALFFSLLQEGALRSGDPKEKKKLLSATLRDSRISNVSGSLRDDKENKDGSGSTFWRTWHSKISQKLQVTEQALKLEQAIPGVDTGRFLEGDEDYIQSTIFSFVESVRTKKESQLAQGLELASSYGLDRFQVLLRHIFAILISDFWIEDDILTNVSGYWSELSKKPAIFIEALETTIYPMLDGTNKARLSCFYRILSDAYAVLENAEEGHDLLSLPCTFLLKKQDKIQYYKLLAQESLRIAVLADLDFKKIAELHGLNCSQAQEEICCHLNGDNLGSILDMVQNLRHLVCMGLSDSEFPSVGFICRTYVLKTLSSCLDKEAGTFKDIGSGIDIIKRKYESCRKHLNFLPYNDKWKALQTLLQVCSSAVQKNEEEQGDGYLSMQDSNSNAIYPLCSLLNLWITALEDIWNCPNQEELEDLKQRKMSLDALADLTNCCKSFEKLIQEKKVDSKAGWMVIKWVGILEDTEEHFPNFIKGMISSGCSLQAVVAVVEGVLENVAGLEFGVVGISGKGESGGIRCLDGSDDSAEKINQVGEQHIMTGLGKPVPDIVFTKNIKSIKNAPDIMRIYMHVVNSALAIMGVQKSESKLNKRFSTQQQVLIMTVSSLHSASDLDSTFHHQQLQISEILPHIRLAVWQRLLEFAESVQNSSRNRVFTLRLLEAISGGDNITRSQDSIGIDGDEIPLAVTWDGWGVASHSNDRGMVLPRFKSILVALRSSQVITAVWSDVEVKAENLASVESASLFFQDLASRAELRDHALVLKSVLEEWSSIFESEEQIPVEQILENTGMAIPNDGTVINDGWGQVEDWGDGWEEFEESKGKVDGKNSAAIEIHSLHMCWKITLQKLALCGCLEVVLETLDMAWPKTSESLVTEEEAMELVTVVSDKDVVSAFKISLVLPFSSPRTFALDSYENKLRSAKFSMRESGKLGKGEGGEDTPAKEVRGRKEMEKAPTVDNPLLTLVLASGLLSIIAKEQKWVNTFSAICTALASGTQQLTNLPSEQFFIRIIIFPFFVGELARTRHYRVAGTIILQLMQVHPALRTLNAAYVALKHFLEGQVLFVKKGYFATLRNERLARETLGSLKCLPNTIERLKNEFESSINSALEVLVQDCAQPGIYTEESLSHT